MKQSQIIYRGIMYQITFQQRTNLINSLIFVCIPIHNQFNIPSIILLIIQLNFRLYIIWANWLELDSIKIKTILTKLGTLLTAI